ncbi:MAG: LAGLIDADG family homing endonuclease [Saprospiraceae bacterium]|nr:LAGLIDADG family homing endonuclease [Saprospiraceae bacterium]
MLQILLSKDTKSMYLDFSRPRTAITYEYKYRVCNNKAVDYSTKEFEVDPYLLGLVLGDGGVYHYKYKCNQYKVMLTAGNDDGIHYENYFNTLGQTFNKYLKKNTTNWSYAFDRKLYDKFDKLGLVNHKSYTKFIPKEYLYGDYNQRLQLLQGLLDTDGYVNVRRGTNNSVNFASVSSQLIHDLVQLARSLGIACKNPKHYNNKYDGYWETTLYTDNPEVFTLERKKKLVVPKTTNGQRSNIEWDIIYNIEINEPSEAWCITVEDDLFLAGDFIVTHNSYYTALAEVEHGIIFDGAKEYTEEFIKGLITAEFCVGSANADKSSELASKIDSSIRAKASPDVGRQFGVWGKEDDDDFTPCPFYKDMTGSIATNNKKNPYRHEYKVELNGRWVTKGTGTKLYHVNYSTKKGDGAQAAAGGRYLVSVEEEWGLEENAIEVHNSNDSTVARDGVFFGVQWKMGTSGNIEYIQSTKKMFLNPKDYRIVSFKNQHGNEGQDGNIGFFLPFYMVLRQYKDKNGNTDYEAAVAHVNKIRAEKTKSTDPKVLRDEKMNRPCFVDEMWVTDKTYYLPYEEAQQREKELMAFGKYKTLEKPVKLIWDSLSPRGVRYEIDHNAEPYREFPIDF